MEFEALRNKMVDTQIIARGIRDPQVIEAMRQVPRHEFIPDQYQRQAYDDMPIPIGEGQTISQPYMVALMTEALNLEKIHSVLEIGTGSGYQAAILAEMAKEVYTIERIPGLAARAEKTLEKLGYKNIHIKVADGTTGWPGKEFDAIAVTAASPQVIDTLVAQLKDGGRLIAPIGGKFGQTLTLYTKKGQEVKTDEMCKVVFVPLVGKFGWKN